MTEEDTTFFGNVRVRFAIKDQLAPRTIVSIEGNMYLSQPVVELNRGLESFLWFNKLLELHLLREAIQIQRTHISDLEVVPAATLIHGTQAQRESAKERLLRRQSELSSLIAMQENVASRCLQECASIICHISSLHSGHESP